MTSLRVASVALPTALAMLMSTLPLVSQQEVTDPEPDVEDLALGFYSGGAAEGVRKVTQDSPSSTTSLVYVNLASAAVSWFVPAGDSDLLNVGFSAECRLINSMISSTNQDWVELRAMISRSPALIGFPTFMEPYDTSTPMAFCDANSFAMHHANFARRVAGGTTGATYRVQIQYRVRNNAPLANALGVLRAWLDDWKLELVAYS
jgi:hypothetical protein